MRNIKILFVVVVLAFTVSYSVFSKYGNVKLSDISLDNIEALAQTEIGPAPEGSTVFCAYGISYGGIGIIRACESCVFQFFVGGYSGTSSCYP